MRSLRNQSIFFLETPLDVILGSRAALEPTVVLDCGGDAEDIQVSVEEENGKGDQDQGTHLLSIMTVQSHSENELQGIQVSITSM